MMTRQLKIIDSVNPKIIHLPIILVLFPSKLFNKEYYGFIQSKPESKIKWYNQNKNYEYNLYYDNVLIKYTISVKSKQKHLPLGVLLLFQKSTKQYSVQKQLIYERNVDETIAITQCQTLKSVWSLVILTPFWVIYSLTSLEMSIFSSDPAHIFRSYFLLDKNYHKKQLYRNYFLYHWQASYEP